MAFGFVVLVWIGAALMTMALLPARLNLSTVGRLLAALLVGQCAGYILMVATTRVAPLALLPDLVIGLALAAWIIWRPGIVAAVVVIVFQAIAILGAIVLLNTHGRGGGAEFWVGLGWRIAIAVTAALFVIERNRSRATITDRP